ncbi:serine protease [Brucella intermedia]|uniref:Serine protease n=1 Tax=Brucella intermedia GD04153 TaxID=2975438 RepID=A0AA42H088_9HYPH|nr:serine protease [Brucella intermedia]MDH0123313.1 serine protease [Brucella intermedia GD04153]
MENPIKLFPLEGTDNESNYKVIGDRSEWSSPKQAIAPIFAVSKDSNREWQFLGTGFFIAQGLLVTARHVFEGIYEEWGEDGFRNQINDPYIIHNVSGNNAIIRPIISTSTSVHTDTIVAQVGTIPNQINACLPLKRDKPKPGDLAFTYAYPNTKVFDGPDGRDVVMEPSFYRGNVIEYFPKKRDSTFIKWPSFQVDFYMHPGASGGPVFDKDGKVFGINCASMEPDRNIAYVTSIDSVKDASVHHAKFEGKFYENLPLRTLIKAGVIKFF